MKFQATTTLLAAASVHARSVHNVGRDLINIPNVEVAISGSVINSAAFVPFQNTRVLLKTPATGTKRQDVVTPDNIFVLQCTEAGFREPCLVFGAAPGDCVSYFDFQPANSTAVSDIFWKNVTSLSVNTGGNCMFYQKKNCNALGDDRGLTAKYIYDMAVALPEDPRIPEYNNNITSWRC